MAFKLNLFKQKGEDKNNDIYAEIEEYLKTPEAQELQRKIDEEKNKYNLEDIKRFYNYFNHTNPTEIRVFDKEKYPDGKSLFVNNEEDFIKKVIEYQNEEVDVYIGGRDRTAKKDENVTSSDFIFLEIDEHDIMKPELKERVEEFLKDNNIEIGMEGFSGGGYHFYIPHSIKEFNSDEDRDFYKRVLTAFKNALKSNGLDIDSKIFNLERVSRILGTYNFKRKETSKILTYNKDIDLEKNHKAIRELIIKYDKEPEEIDDKVNESAIQLLEKYKINETDKWLYDMVKDKVVIKADTGGNSIVFKDAAIILTRENIPKEEIEVIAKGIVELTEDRTLSAFYGWIKKCKNNELFEVYKNKLNDFISDNKYPLTPYELNDRRIIEIKLAGKNRLMSQLSQEIGKAYSTKNILFYKPELHKIVCIDKFKLKDKNNEEKEYLAFSEINPQKFITFAEKNIKFYHKEFDPEKEEWVIIYKSMNANEANIVLESPQFQSELPIIKRIFTIPIPIIYEGKLTFPKKGYDERFYSWLDIDSPEIIDIEIDKAKEIINSLFSEFCYKDPIQDKVHSIAALITPMLRGLYSKWNVRTPVFARLANRERAGKDYEAGISSIVYEGFVREDSPISDGNIYNNNSDETRKKIFSAALAGRKRMHFSNCKGYIDNAAFESAVTNPQLSDRLLGGNKIVDIDNEMEYSFSGNVGISWTADLDHRSRFINLVLEDEDPNKRVFVNPNLHTYVIENRTKIISSIYALIKYWVDKGMPKGQTKFSSFPEWASICGGIMVCNGLGDPCLAQKTFNIGGNSETRDMKTLFEIAEAYFQQDAKPKPFTKKELMTQILSSWQQDYNIFDDIDFNVNTQKSKFSRMFLKYVGRILSDIKLSQESGDDLTQIYTKFTLRRV